MFSSQNQELIMNQEQLNNDNFNNNFDQVDYKQINSAQNLNHDFIRSKILNRSLKKNTSNYDILIENIIDDLLIENVYELQDIEEKQEKLKQKEHMKIFIKDYYKNFEDIKKLEDNVFEKLHTNDYGIRMNPHKHQIVLDGKEDRRHILYKNPFEAAINKSIDQINQNSMIIVEKEFSNDRESNAISNKNEKKNTLKSKSKNQHESKSNSKEKEIKKQNKKIHKTNFDDKSLEMSNSKSRESIKSPNKKDNSTNSINKEDQETVKDDNKIDLQEKIKQNFINHLITNDYNFNDNYNNKLIIDNNRKHYYVVKLHKNFTNICEKYKKEYDDYMRTTGVFFIPNVFVLYEDVVSKLTNEIFEECISKSLKELDEMALNLVKSEVENKM